MWGRCRHLTVKRDTMDTMKVEALTLAHKVDGMWHVSLQYYPCNVNNKILFLSRWNSLGSQILVGLHLGGYGTTHLLFCKTTK
jgi:hypothetical protein